MGWRVRKEWGMAEAGLTLSLGLFPRTCGGGEEGLTLFLGLSSFAHRIQQLEIWGIAAVGSQGPDCVSGVVPSCRWKGKQRPSGSPLGCGGGVTSLHVAAYRPFDFHCVDSSWVTDSVDSLFHGGFAPAWERWVGVGDRWCDVLVLSGAWGRVHRCQCLLDIAVRGFPVGGEPP